MSTEPEISAEQWLPWAHTTSKVFMTFIDYKHLSARHEGQQNLPDLNMPYGPGVSQGDAMASVLPNQMLQPRGNKWITYTDMELEDNWHEIGFAYQPVVQLSWQGRPPSCLSKPCQIVNLSSWPSPENYWTGNVSGSRPIWARTTSQR